MKLGGPRAVDMRCIGWRRSVGLLQAAVASAPRGLHGTRSSTPLLPLQIKALGWVQGIVLCIRR